MREGRESCAPGWGQSVHPTARTRARGCGAKAFATVNFSLHFLYIFSWRERVPDPRTSKNVSFVEKLIGGASCPVMGCCVSCVSSFYNRAAEAKAAKDELGLSELGQVDLLTQGSLRKAYKLFRDADDDGNGKVC